MRRHVAGRIARRYRIPVPVSSRASALYGRGWPDVDVRIHPLVRRAADGLAVRPRYRINQLNEATVGVRANSRPGPRIYHFEASCLARPGSSDRIPPANMCPRWSSSRPPRHAAPGPKQGARPLGNRFAANMDAIDAPPRRQDHHCGVDAVPHPFHRAYVVARCSSGRHRRGAKSDNPVPRFEPDETEPKAQASEEIRARRKFPVLSRCDLFRGASTI